MTLWIEHYDFEYDQYPVRDLHKICPDPNLSFDVGPAINDRWPSGQVTYPAVTVESPWCRMIFGIVRQPIPVVIKARPPWLRIQNKGELHELRDFAAFTYWPGSPSTTPRPASITVVYDPTDDGGNGYWVEDADGDKIASPADTMLVHELAHAEVGLVDAVDVGHEEVYPIGRENAYRESRGLPTRVGHGGGNGLHPVGGGSNCFVATAAYGSALDPAVASLRHFRDDVLMRTRAGRRFFEDYYARYYRLSPDIVRAMEADDELRQIVRWSFVAPIVAYLRIVTTIPDAPLDDVPEPWRAYLSGLLGELEEWAVANVALPEAFGALSAAQAVDELSIALRLMLRSTASRRAYLEQLEARGDLPLRAAPAERPRLAARLRVDGRSEEELERILGAEAMAR